MVKKMIGEHPIIQKYKYAFFDEYDTYIEVIKYLNENIKQFYFLEKDHDKLEPLKFTYPEFCSKFLKQLNRCIKKDIDISDKIIIQNIFQNMITQKMKDYHKIHFSE